MCPPQYLRPGRLSLSALFLAAHVAARAELPPARDPSVAAALRVLAAYRADGPAVPTSKPLRLVCWRSCDRDFPAGYRTRLRGIMEHIRNFYASEMARNGFGRLTFALDYTASGELVLYEATGSSPSDAYTKQAGGTPIREDCWRALRAAGLDPDHETVVIFTNLATWDPAALTFSHHSPYMGAGSNRSGVAWQLDHPALDVKNLTLKAPLIQDGEYGRISLGKHNSIFIGGIAHELGHALGLPHCRESEAEAAALGTALMGSGNRTYGDPLRAEGKGTFLSLGSALRLASHPLFCRSAKGLSSPALARFTNLAVQAGRTEFTVTGRVAADVPVYALAAYLDPEGHDDYDARTAVAALDPNGAFTLRCSGLVAGKPGALRLCACHANGAVTVLQREYRVGADGAPDVATLTAVFALEPFLAALERGDLAQARTLRDALPEGTLRRLASHLLEAPRAGAQPTLACASVPAAVKRIPLSQLKPAQAKVGWGQPAYDRLPGQDALLIAGGELFETGLYAHAPSAYRYDLANTGWKRLVGTCGLPLNSAASGGSVVFVIRADGQELLRTPMLRTSRTQTFDLNVAGVRELELLTEDGGNGNRCDWGLWLGTRLER